jgi:uridine nucleosidase
MGLMTFYRDMFGIAAGPPLHYPLVIAAILTGTEHEIPYYDWDICSQAGTLSPRNGLQSRP